jgi:soluble lytic murein transglycosylase-like protein
MGTSAAIRNYVGIIKRYSAVYEVDPYLIGAIIAQESGGPYCLSDGSANPFAIRVEQGFWRNYAKRILAWVATSPSKYDDRWSKYPDIYACSYGLGQIMLQTAYENGFNGIFPTELCDPEVNIRLICKIIAKHIEKTGSVKGALLKYNGGGNPEYPAHVLAHRDELFDAKVFG